MLGQPTKLTPARHAAIIADIEAGNYFETACRANGIGKSTAYGWLDRGKAERERIEAGLTDTQRTENGDPPAHLERRYLEFSDAVERARARAEEKHLANVQRIALGGQVIEEEEVIDPESGKVIGRKRKYHLGDWRASGFVLERAHARNWGRRQTVEVSGPEGGPVQVDASDGVRIAEQLREFLAGVRNDPRIIEGRVVASRTELVGGPPVIESGTGADDDAR